MQKLLSPKCLQHSYAGASPPGMALSPHAYPLASPMLARSLRQVFGAPWRWIPVAGASGGGLICHWPGSAGRGDCNFCAAGASKDSGWRVLRAFPPADGWASGTGAPHAMRDNSKQKGDSMNLSEPLRSGRRGQWVYYMRGNKQCRRRYVCPRDPRTPGQLRSRQTFGAASKAWSSPGCPHRRGRTCAPPPRRCRAGRACASPAICSGSNTSSNRPASRRGRLRVEPGERVTDVPPG